MLVRVRDPQEAAQAAAARADAVELGVTAATSSALAIAQAVRSAFPGRLRLRFEGPGPAADVVRSFAEHNMDEMAVPLAALACPNSCFDAGRSAGLRAIAVLDALPDDLHFIASLGDRIDGIMLDVGPDARLIDAAGIAALDVFASACRASRLPFGLGGGLEAPDVARLLLLEPQLLAFDTGLRHGHIPDGALDPEVLDAIRALIPPEGTAQSKGAVTKVIDRVFVNDFAVSLAIGAYHAERMARQRVRFSVVAEVVRDPRPPRDMRDVFSYDVIIETIRVLAERAHVAFVETLAEEVAASLLKHGEVVAVTVKVEKLDVIPGAVGIEIVRRSATS